MRNPVILSFLIAFLCRSAQADLAIEGQMAISTIRGTPPSKSTLGNFDFTVLVSTNGDFKISTSTPRWAPQLASYSYSLTVESNILYYLFNPIGTGSVTKVKNLELSDRPSLTVLPGRLPVFPSNPRDGWPCLWLAFGFGEQGWSTLTNNAEMPNIFLTPRAPITLGWLWRFEGFEKGAICPESLDFIRSTALDRPLDEELLNPFLSKPHSTSAYAAFRDSWTRRKQVSNGFTNVAMRVEEYQSISGSRVPSKFSVRYFSIGGGPHYEYNVTCNRMQEIRPVERIRPAFPTNMAVIDYRVQSRSSRGSIDSYGYRLTNASELPNLDAEEHRKWIEWQVSVQPNRSFGLFAVLKSMAMILGVALLVIGPLVMLRKIKSRGLGRKP